MTESRLLSPAAVLLAAWAPHGAAAQDRTVVERLLADLNPCAGLVTEQLGQRIGIEELDDVRLPEVDLLLRGDEVTARFSGMLSCRAPSGAILSGDASAAIDGEAMLSLDDCGVRDVAISLSDFGGTFGLALQAFAPSLEQSLEGEARTALERGCREALGRQ